MYQIPQRPIPLFIMLCLSILCLNPSLSHAQEEIGGGAPYNATAGPPLNLDIEEKLPKVFPPTDPSPRTRDRETLADQTNSVVQEKTVYRAGFTLGAQYGQFDKFPYTDIYLSPYMQLGPFFLMYEIPLRFDWNSSFVTQLWTSAPAALAKIEMDLYYAKANHVFRYIKTTITDPTALSMGHGRFLYDYNPNLLAPYETTKSLNFGLDVSYVGFNFILANIGKPDMMAAELYLRPFARLKNPKFQAYQDFKIYLVFGTDLDPYQNFSEELYKYNPNPNAPKFSMYEVGLDFPVYKTMNNVFELELYGDYSQILASSQGGLSIKSGSGVAGGIIFNFLQKIPIRVEIAQAFGSWQPHMVDSFYDTEKTYYKEGTSEISNKFMNIIPDLTYYTVAMGFQLPEKAFFVNIELYGDVLANDLGLTVSLSLGNILLKQLSFSVAFTMKNLTQENFFTLPNTIMIDLNLKYHMLPNMYWGILFKMNDRIGNTEDLAGTPIVGTKPFIFLGMDYSFRY